MAANLHYKVSSRLFNYFQLLVHNHFTLVRKGIHTDYRPVEEWGKERENILLYQTIIRAAEQDDREAKKGFES